MTERDTPDIFQWANLADANRAELEIELFLFSKSGVPYRINHDSRLSMRLGTLFLLDTIAGIQTAAAAGHNMADYDHYTGADEQILHVPVDDVTFAFDLVAALDTAEDFDYNDKQFKRIPGILAKITSKTDESYRAYVIKALSKQYVEKGAGAWTLTDGKASLQESDVTFKVPGASHVLIFDDEIFALDVDQFEKIFNYNRRRYVTIEQKCKEIEANYRLSFPEGVTLLRLALDRKQAGTKMLSMEIGNVTQDDAVNYADEVGLELMTDSATGAIIIMDGSDLDVFLNLINEDYATNDITGRKYEIKRKKEMAENNG